IAVLADSNSASAQSAAPPTAVYAVKFVCGTEAPTNVIAPPAEQNVKPGNYATVINVEYLSFPAGSTDGSYKSWWTGPHRAALPRFTSCLPSPSTSTVRISPALPR